MTNITVHHMDTYYYTLSLHILGLCQLPVNMLALYCILYKSHRNMSFYYKFLLAKYQALTGFCDFGITILLAPVLFFPYMGWLPTGVASWLGVSTILQTAVTICTIQWVGGTIFLLFYTRYTCSHTDSTSTMSDKKRIILGCLLCVSFNPALLAKYYELPENMDKAKLELAAIWKDPVDLLWNRNTLVMGACRICISHIAFAVLTTATAVPIFICFLLTWRNLTRRNAKLSAATLKIQRKFLWMLVGQISVPTILMAVPLCFSYGAISYNPVISRLCIFAISNHGFLSSLFLLFANQPYRDFILSKLGKKRQNTTIHVEASTNYDLTKTVKIRGSNL